MHIPLIPHLITTQSFLPKTCYVEDNSQKSVPACPIKKPIQLSLLSTSLPSIPPPFLTHTSITITPTKPTLSPFNHNISPYLTIPNILKACRLHSIPIQPQHISVYLHPLVVFTLSPYNHNISPYLTIPNQKLVVFTLSPYNHNISPYLTIPNILKACRLHSIPIQPQHISVSHHPQHTKSLSSSLYPHTTTTYLCISPSPTYQKLVVFTPSPYNHNISLYISIPNIPKACRLHSIPIQPQHISVYLHPQHTKSLSSSLHPHTTTTYLCISPSPTY